MVLRVCPVPANQTLTGTMDPTIMDKCLLNYDNSDNYKTEPAYGFKFRNLDNLNVYYDEVHRRLMGNYRLLYSQYAAYTLEKMRDTAKCIAVLNTLEKNVSTVQFPLQYDEETQIALILNEAGAKDKAKKYAQMAVADCNNLFVNTKLRRGRGDRMIDEVKGSHGTYKCAAESYQILGQYDEARKVLLQLYDLCRQALQAQGGQFAQNDVQAIQKNMYDVLGNVVAVDNAQLTDLEKAGKKQDAIAKGNSLINQYNQSADQLEKSLTNYVQDKLNKIQGKPSVIDTAAR